MTTPRQDLIQTSMNQAIQHCVDHVASGGLPFVGVLLDDQGITSKFGVNEVQETGDPTAHAEIVAMRDAIQRGISEDLSNNILLATGEPCGLCYRFAIDHGITEIYVAVDRYEAAVWGFDYTSSYLPLGVTDEIRKEILHHLPCPHGSTPFRLYIENLKKNRL